MLRGLSAAPQEVRTSLRRPDFFSDRPVMERARSGKSPKLTSQVLCSRDAVFPSDRIIALVGYDYRNSQGLLRLAQLGADRNRTFLPACCGYRADIH
jgi:hypothetical protein